MITRRQLKDLRDLAQKKRREERRCFLIEGVRLTGEAAGSEFEILEAFHTEAFAGEPDGRALIEKLQRKGARLSTITERELSTVSDTVTAQGILAVVAARQFDLKHVVSRGNDKSVFVVLDAVSDPGNLGTMIRTCDWFGADAILLGNNSVELYNPKVVRATMGGVFHLPIVEDVDLAETIPLLKGAGYTVYVTDAAGDAFAGATDFAGRSAVIFGNEARGVSPAVMRLADTRVAIRRYGNAESLNVGVACGVVLAALRTAER